MRSAKKAVKTGEPWPPEMAAQELHRRRKEFVGRVGGRPLASGVPPSAHDEIVTDAITALVMSRKPVANEQHLLGGFWVAVDHQLRHYHEARHLTKLGSRERIGIGSEVEQIAAPGEPVDELVFRERIALAAEWMGALEKRERELIYLMATRGVGPGPAGNLLGMTELEARAVERRARQQLHRIAVISAAGRMCGYRFDAIVADAAGEATDRQVDHAQRHVRACVPCHRMYSALKRDTHGRDFRRRAAAAFVPAPVVGFGHHASWIARLADWASQRGFPKGAGERATEMLGGAGLGAKAATAGGSLLLAAGAAGGTALTVGIVDTTSRTHHHHQRIHRKAPSAATGTISTSRAASASLTRTVSFAPPKIRPATRPVRHSSSPPSRGLGYLAVGGAVSPTSSVGESRAHVALVGHPHSASHTTTSSSTSAGGGSDLSYLGK